jgi:hypothetical protein
VLCQEATGSVAVVASACGIRGKTHEQQHHRLTGKHVATHKSFLYSILYEHEQVQHELHVAVFAPHTRMLSQAPAPCHCFKHLCCCLC